MFLEPSANDLSLEINASNLDWAKTIEILRASLLEVDSSIFDEAKKHLTNLSIVEQKLILNAGRGVLRCEDTKQLLKYAKITNKKTILILSTFNKCSHWAKLVKNILNISSKDININFGADPKCSEAIYSRQPIAGLRVYITDVNGLNRLVSNEFFDGTMFGNKIDLMIVDKFFQTLLMIPNAIVKEIFSIVFIDAVYFSKNFDSLKCFESIAWTEEQQLAIKEISKLFEKTFSINIEETIKVLREVDFILG